jgi:hypothetical protein
VETEAKFDIEALAIDRASSLQANLNPPRHIWALLDRLLALSQGLSQDE